MTNGLKTPAQLKVDKMYKCRYKTSSKKFTRGTNERNLIITKAPYYHSRYKKGMIVKALDLSDSKTKHTKVFYVENFISANEMNSIDEVNEGNPPEPKK